MRYDAEDELLLQSTSGREKHLAKGLHIYLFERQTTSTGFYTVFRILLKTKISAHIFASQTRRPKASVEFMRPKCIHQLSNSTPKPLILFMEIMQPHLSASEFYSVLNPDLWLHYMIKNAEPG